MKSHRFTQIRETFEVRLNEKDLERLHKGESITKLVCTDGDERAVEETCVEISLNDSATPDAQAIPVGGWERRKKR